jgi:hypothetical protein
MGSGVLLGSTPSIWHYFRPQDGNPFVLAFIGSIFILSVISAGWVMFGDGVSKIVEFQLPPYSRTTAGNNPTIMKVLLAIGPLFIALWVFGVIQMDLPIQEVESSWVD